MNKLDVRSERKKNTHYYRYVVKALLCFFILIYAHVSQAAQSHKAYAIYSSLSEDLFLASFSLEAEKALEFKFLGSQLSSRRFTRLMLQNATVNNGQELIQQQVEAIEIFNKIIRVKGKYQRGDHLIFRDNAGALVVSFNGVELGVVESPALFDILLHSWIGEIPPSRVFKDAVLGNSNSASTTQDVFEGLHYSRSRHERVAAIVVNRSVKNTISQANIEALSPPEAPSKSVAKVVNADHTVEQAEGVVEGQQVASIEPLVSEVVVDEDKEREDQLKREAEKKQKELEKARQAAAAEAERQRLEESQRLLSEALLKNGREKFAKVLVQHTQKNIRYPIRSRKLRQTGSVMAVVTIDRGGSLLGFELEDKTKYRMLNEAVAKGVKRSAPFPQVPELIEGTTFTFQVPVAFALE